MISKSFYSLFIYSVIITLLLFLAHAMPFNENVIEKNIVSSKTKHDKIIGYIYAYIYYVIFMMIGMYVLGL